MHILTIDTSTEMTALGLTRDGQVLAEAAFPSRQALAQRLLPRLDWLLGECGVAKTDLEAVALGLGPGAFTGVRIGAAAAKMLAQWLHIPLVGIPTLEALAYPFRDCRDDLLAPVINARRQQAYLALFRGGEHGLERLTPDLVLAAEPFGETLRQHLALGRRAACIGLLEGLPASFQEAMRGAAAVRSAVTPHALAALAAARLQRGEADDPMTLAPIYLRGAT